MKKHITLSISLLILLAGTLLLSAGQQQKMKKMKPVTVSGILVDTKCYGMMHDNMYNDHMTPKGKMPKCAAACAAMGIPVGLLVDGKKGEEVIFLVTPASQLANYMAKTARITGQKALGGIIPTAIEVKENGKWKKVEIGTMM